MVINSITLGSSCGQQCLGAAQGNWSLGMGLTQVSTFGFLTGQEPTGGGLETTRLKTRSSPAPCTFSPPSSSLD